MAGKQDNTRHSKLVFEVARASADSEQKVNVNRRIFKIIVIGDSNVGKTCLTYRFCIGKFPNKTESTIGVDFREKTIQVDKETIKLQLWDTAGQERFRKSMVQHYYRNVHAVVFVYDMTNPSSFDSLHSWIEECDHHNLSMHIPRILVGNKLDEVGHIAIDTNLAQTFADRYNMPLFETSAKDDDKSNHVESIFMTVAYKLKNAQPMMPVHLSDYVPGQVGAKDFFFLQSNPKHRGLQSATDQLNESKMSDCAC